MSQNEENNALEGDPDATLQAQAEQRQAADSEESDHSDALFSMYLSMVYHKDNEMVKSWKEDANGMLTFTGLFSAAVAALLALSVPNLSQSPQTTTNFYLANIFQQLNGSHLPIPSSLGLSDPSQQFKTPRLAVWVNALWFLSLVMSLTCALLSTLLLRWARRYLKVAYPRYSPHKKARIRAFYKNGVDKLHFPWMIEFIPTLLHISLFLFFAGLSIFLRTVNHTIFTVVTIWIAICVVLYASLTFLPHFRKDSPYTAPLSTSISFCLTSIRYLFSRLLQKFPQHGASVCIPLLSQPRDSRAARRTDLISHSMSKTAEESAFKLDPDIDYKSLLWTLQSLDEDTDLEKFFERLPRLCESKPGKDLKLKEGFIGKNEKELSNALIGLMNRTLPSNMVSESVRHRRMIICTKVVNSTSLLGLWWFLQRVLLGEWSKFLECFEFGLFVQNWKTAGDKVTTFAAQCVAALTTSILRARGRDKRWVQLASGLLGVPDSLLHKYIANGDSILLANAIFIVRQTVQTYSGSKDRHRTDILDASTKTLGTVWKLKIEDTLPELQHEFCDLWNKLIQMAKTDTRPHHVVVANTTLKNIRKLYIALHKSSLPAAECTAVDDPNFVDNPDSYSMCTHKDHRPALAIPDLKFDEPDPGGSTIPNTTGISMPIPTIPHSPPQLSTFISPYYSSSPSAPYLSVPSPYGQSFAYPPSQSAQSAASSLDATVPFPEPHVTHSDASNAPRGGNVQSPQSPPPPRPASVVSSTI